MKTIILLFVCASISAVSAGEKKIWARITFYNPKESGGWEVSAPNIKRNKQGWGVSAHPDFKFFTKVEIPALKGVLNKDGVYTVLDRGSAVTSKKAAKGKAYVFDVFTAKTGREFDRFVKSMPTWAWVIIK